MPCCGGKRKLKKKSAEYDPRKDKRPSVPHYIVSNVPCSGCHKRTGQIIDPKTNKIFCVQCYKGPKPLELCNECGMQGLEFMYSRHIERKLQHSINLIKTMIKRYPKIAVACSFGKDSMVILHLAVNIRHDIPVFGIMTPFKPKATLRYKNKIVDNWGLNYTEYRSKQKVPWSLHLTDPDECCRILKVLPTQEAVKDLDCWITGLRNTEGRTRTDYKEIERKGGLVKVNPILTWTEAEVWRYLATRRISINPLYPKGFRSLGCLPCSNPGGGLERSGRWQGTFKAGGECGIHTMKLKKG